MDLGSTDPSACGVNADQDVIPPLSSTSVKQRVQCHCVQARQTSSAKKKRHDPRHFSCRRQPAQPEEAHHFSLIDRHFRTAQATPDVFGFNTSFSRALLQSPVRPFETSLSQGPMSPFVARATLWSSHPLSFARVRRSSTRLLCWKLWSTAHSTCFSKSKCAEHFCQSFRWLHLREYISMIDRSCTARNFNCPSFTRSRSHKFMVCV